MMRKEQIMYLLVFLSLAATFFVWVKTKGSGEDKIIRGMLSAMVGLCAALVWLGISLIIVKVYPQDYVFEEQGRLELVAFNNISGIEGSFFLASGSFKSRYSYVFFYKTHGEGKRFGKLDASEVVIYEEKRNDGYILELKKVPDKESPAYRRWWWAVPDFVSDNKDLTLWAAHVPEGTVLKEFKVDLGNFNR